MMTSERQQQQSRNRTHRSTRDATQCNDRCGVPAKNGEKGGRRRKEGVIFGNRPHPACAPAACRRTNIKPARQATGMLQPPQTMAWVAWVAVRLSLGGYFRCARVMPSEASTGKPLQAGWDSVIAIFGGGKLGTEKSRIWLAREVRLQQGAGTYGMPRRH